MAGGPHFWHGAGMESPPSPCNGVCRIRPDGFCAGCRRTLDEIAAWPTLDGRGKQAVLDRLAARKP